MPPKHCGRGGPCINFKVDGHYKLNEINMFIIFKVKSILQPDPEGPPDPGGHSSAVKEVFKDEG